MSKTKPRIACVVTCYKQPDYVRAVTLARGMEQSGVFDEVIVIRNTAKGIWRYAQVFGQLMRVRFSKNPDVYLATFRAYEILPFLLVIAAGKQVIYDEFINPVEWFVYEHNKLGLGFFWAAVLRPLYRFLGKRVDYILTDTTSHAEYSAGLMNLPLDTYRAIPVSTDEKMFHPLANTATGKPFKVLYIGNMLPLYGVEYVIEAAVLLADNPDIEFTIAGNDAVAAKIIDAKKRGARIHHQGWVQYTDFPDLFRAHDLLMAGPFGKTIQSQFVITGKAYQFLAMGLPVVIGENKESHAFADKQNALIVPPQNAKALQETIKWAANHPNELRKIAANGRKLYEKEYSSARVAADLRLLFAK